MAEFGVPTDEQLAKINKLAKRNLTKEEVFVFPNKLAGDMIIPGRYVQLTKELLDVFSSDAKTGVSLLLDHSWAPDGFAGLGGRPKMAMSYGRTFDSKYETSTEEGETIALVADHYMKRGIELDGIKTDDLIASIEAGTLFDSSIGFSYSKAICSVCGKNYRNYDECKHFAGKTYEIEDDDGVTRQKLCYIKAKPPGFLMENSLVFDGAYPTAGVLSKTGDILENETGIYQVVTEAKDIDPSKPLISTYSNRGGLLTMVKKSDHKKPYSLGGIKDEKLKGAEKPMDEKTLAMLKELGIEYKEGETKEEELLSKIAEKFDSIKPTEPTEPKEEFMSKEKASEKLGKELSADEVLKLAKEGQEYHKTLSDEALAMGVRAMGNDFPKETWEKSFATMSSTDIKNIMKTWEAQANLDIPSGRQTNPSLDGTQSQNLPDEAFM